MRFHGVVEIIIDNVIRIPSVGDIKKQYPWFWMAAENDLTIANPAYLQAVKYGWNTYQVPEKLELWVERNDGMAVMPRGYAGRLLWLLRKHNVPYTLRDKRLRLPEIDIPRAGIKLRDYQERAIEAAMRVTQGIIQAPAGSGKTVIGLALVARIKQPALWLVHTKDLAEQAVERAVVVLGIPREEIGMIGAGVEKIGPRLTIGVVQKMARMNLRTLQSLANRWGCVILDEAHHIGGALTWGNVLNALPARYRYGITATVERADGLDAITRRIIGPLLYQVQREEVKRAGGIITPELVTLLTSVESREWNKYEAQAERDRAEGKKPKIIPYHKILKEILENKERNEIIIETLARECPGNYSLVLSERVTHCERLAEMLKKRVKGIKAAIIHGRLNKKRRQEILEAMNRGEIEVLFAVDVAKEGLDIPRLNRLFLVGGGRNAAEIEQKVGRIQRPHSEKQDAKVFDFLDEKIGVLAAQYYARQKVYKRLGLKIAAV